MDNKLQPKWTTIVDPAEYNVRKEIEFQVWAANTARTAKVQTDVGKLVGLYLAYRRLLAYYMEAQ